MFLPVLVFRKNLTENPSPAPLSFTEPKASAANQAKIQPFPVPEVNEDPKASEEKKANLGFQIFLAPKGKKASAGKRVKKASEEKRANLVFQIFPVQSETLASAAPKVKKARVEKKAKSVPPENAARLGKQEHLVEILQYLVPLACKVSKVYEVPKVNRVTSQRRSPTPKERHARLYEKSLPNSNWFSYRKSRFSCWLNSNEVFIG